MHLGGKIKPFIIDIQGIPQEGFHLSEEFDPSHFDLDKFDNTRFEDKIKANLSLSLVGMNYNIKVDLDVPIITECVKCLAEFSRIEHFEFMISGQVNSKGTVHDSLSDPVYDEGYREKSASRGAPKGLIGSRIDIAPAIRQEILLSIDEYPYCTEDCLGLCPECGANLNLGPCECEEE